MNQTKTYRHDLPAKMPLRIQQLPVDAILGINCTLTARRVKGQEKQEVGKSKENKVVS